MGISSVKVTKPVNSVGAYKPQTYESQYGGQLDEALNNVVNFQYDPMKDASYKALANLYNTKGNQAAQNTLGNAAALNGGYGTSYGVSAAEQARNDYNQQLASMIPDLEDKAYNRANNRLNALRDADNTNYNRFRDNVSDSQWAWSNAYNQYRDAMSDYQWGMNYNLDVYQAKKSKSSRGGRAGGSGGGGYGSSGYTDNFLNTVKTDAKPKYDGHSMDAAGKGVSLSKAGYSAVNKKKK